MRDLVVKEEDNNNINVWQNPDEIKALFAPNLTKEEFNFFMTLGQGLGANPFIKEIWAVKWDKSKPAQIFLGRDFYRRKAQEQPSYNGHIVEAYYENDVFERKITSEGIEINHIPALKDRGKLIGAYCVLWKKDTKPIYHSVLFSEYNKGQSTWKEKPETMTKKVVESQTCRMAYQGIYGGTYDESENWIETEYEEVKEPLPKKPKKKKEYTLEELKDKFLKKVNSETDGYYKHIIHLENTLNQVLGENNWKWQDQNWKEWEEVLRIHYEEK